MRMAIKGVGVTGAFGSGVDALRSALQNKTITSEESDGVSIYQAPIDGLDEFIPKRALRRIDHLSKMTLLSACLALKDADLLNADRTRTGVVIATGYGTLQTTFKFLDSYLDFGYACSSPTHFSNSVHNSAAAHVAMQLTATAPSLTVTQFEMSVSSALITARQWLAEERVDHVLFGAVDETAEVLSYCREQFFGSGEKGPLQPFSFDKQSAVAGEGAVSFILTRSDHSPYGFIDEIRLGNHRICAAEIPQKDLLIIGADGHKGCGQLYESLIKGRNTAAYAPLYGSFPAANGFDLAVAAVSLCDRTVYASPELAGATDITTLPTRKLDGKGVVCLKFSNSGHYGLIRLSL